MDASVPRGQPETPAAGVKQELPGVFLRGDKSAVHANVESAIALEQADREDDWRMRGLEQLEAANSNGN